MKFYVALVELQEQHVDGVGFGTAIVGCLSPWLHGLVTGFLGVTSNKQILFVLSSKLVFV